jgi:hypothetical protein
MCCCRNKFSVWDLRFSRQQILRLRPTWTWHRVIWQICTNITKEAAAFISYYEVGASTSLPLCTLLHGLQCCMTQKPITWKSPSKSKRIMDITLLIANRYLCCILWPIRPLLSNDSVNSGRCYVTHTIEKRCFLCGPRRDSCHATAQ